MLLVNCSWTICVKSSKRLQKTSATKSIKAISSYKQASISAIKQYSQYSGKMQHMEADGGHIDESLDLSTYFKWSEACEQLQCENPSCADSYTNNMPYSPRVICQTHP